MRVGELDKRQQVMVQLGQYCNTAKCMECPIYKAWSETGAYNNCCMEYLRFPDIAARMDEVIKERRK